MKWKLDDLSRRKLFAVVVITPASRASTGEDKGKERNSIGAKNTKNAMALEALETALEALESAAMLLFLVLVCCAFSSCEPLPSAPPATLSSSALKSGGAYILCEGLWRQDNSTLWRYDDSSDAVIGDVFAGANPGLRLGDTANDMLLKGDTLFIAVSTSRTIEIIRASTAEWLARIRFGSTRQEPRRLTIFDDSTAFCSNLNDDSITELDTRSCSVRTPRILVGPAPEGIASTRRFVLVANSGFGDFRASEPKAGSVSVFDPRSRSEARIVEGLPNATEILVHKDKTRFYVAYRHLPSKPDSLGGIVEFDAETLAERQRWRLRTPSSLCFSSTGDTLFFLGASGVHGLKLGAGAGEESFLVLPNPNSREFWYGLAVHPKSSELWVCNARNFSVNGEVLIFQANRTLKRRFDVGINPNKVVFFSR